MMRQLCVVPLMIQTTSQSTSRNEMTTQQFDDNDYKHTLSVLNKRAKYIKIQVFIFMFFALIISSIVAVIGYNTYKSPSSPLANAISSTIDAGKQEQTLKVLRSLLSSESGINSSNLHEENESNKAINEKVNSMSDTEVDKELSANWLRPSLFYKSTSEKIAESISSVIVTFGILMFVGFSLRATLVFIRYYMQLGTDFDNQRIAFMLSKGEENLFSKNLSTLREHNINFEKTPNIPQEKIIDKLIELSKNLKNDSDKS